MQIMGARDLARQGAELKMYRRQLGLTHRSITEHRGNFRVCRYGVLKGPDVVFNFFSPEVFENLGRPLAFCIGLGGSVGEQSGVSPGEVLQSLGLCAPEYRTAHF